MGLPRVVYLQPEAPAKPELGAPCNGCGLCCLSEPCPLGVVMSRRRTGACAALRWDAVASRYHCGVLADARQPLWRWLVRRWIAAGVGCDAELESAPLGRPKALSAPLGGSDTRSDERGGRSDSEPAQQPPAAAGDQQK